MEDQPCVRHLEADISMDDIGVCHQGTFQFCTAPSFSVLYCTVLVFSETNLTLRATETTHRSSGADSVFSRFAINDHPIYK